MKRSPITALLITCLLIPVTSQAGENAQQKFDKIKALAGTWHGAGPSGNAVTVTYEVVSNGSAVMERIEHEGEDNMNMITMYHLDGDRLLMTHYCSAKNQPRMRAVSADGDENVIQFELLDITNLAKPADGHMQKMAMHFKGKNLLATEWTFVQDGKAHTGPFELRRMVENK